MKQQLTEEDRRALVAYRLERAHETMKEIPYHIENGYYATAVNRLYYACYYAVGALLIQNGLHAQTHNGVIQLFGLHFVKTGKVSKEQGKLYNQLFSLRLTGDYNDSYTLCEEDVLPLIEPAREMIIFIEQILKK